jgi:hypothetical protein
MGEMINVCEDLDVRALKEDPIHCYEDNINPLTPNDPYRGRAAPLTSKVAFYVFIPTNIDTEYFKHGINSPFYSSSKCSLFHNSNLFVSCIIHVLYTGCAKIKKNNSGARRLKRSWRDTICGF